MVTLLQSFEVKESLPKGVPTSSGSLAVTCRQMSFARGSSLARDGVNLHDLVCGALCCYPQRNSSGFAAENIPCPYIPAEKRQTLELVRKERFYQFLAGSIDAAIASILELM